MKFFTRALPIAAVLLAMVSARAEPDHMPDRQPHRPEAVQQPAPRTLDVPRRLADIRRDLKVASAWVALEAQRPSAIRAGLEHGGKVVAALTLDPANGKPVAYLERGNFRPSSLPTDSVLGGYLSELRKDSADVKFGAYVLPSPRGLEVQVYWSGKLVSYLYVDPNNGAVQSDEAAAREISNSPLRVR